MIDYKNELKTLSNNRKNLYILLARFFSKEADEEFLKELAGLKLPLDRKENEIVGFKAALERLAAYFEYDAGESLEDLAVDYAKTFLGAGQAQGVAAMPYESVYTSSKKIVMQEAWSDICDIYAAKGIEPDCSEDKILEDHISLEMNFMAYLIEEGLEMTEMLPSLEEQKSFINKHLLNWLPAFCIDVRENADTEFYRMAAELVSSFVRMDAYILDRIINDKSGGIVSGASYKCKTDELDKVLAELKKSYRVYAPKFTKDAETGEETDIVRYQEIDSVSEMVLDKQSDFSPKEVIYPISQTIFSFDENGVKETTYKDPKGIVVFARACDINALKRMDNIFLSNGGWSDVYYKQYRDRLKVFLIECKESFDKCYCVSMGTNKSEDYSVAFGFNGDDIKILVKDVDFDNFFKDLTKADYAPSFVEENKLKVRIPSITKDNMKDVFALDMWKKYNDECISCGGCNTVCPTCTCFDTKDYLNQENSRRGERRRIWSSCMLPEYSKTAGGNVARKQPDTMMRFKTMHKIYDYNARFGGSEHMCVGCGRCINRCPEDIDFSNTINTLAEEVDKLEVK